MAFETPFHLKRGHLPYQRHLIDSAVAGRAAHSFVDVNAVIEIDEVGQIVHALPDDRLTGAPAFADRLQIRAVCKELRVTVHARLCRRYSGKRRFFDRRMAIAAIYSVIADVMFMTELNRLFLRLECAGGIGRPAQLGEDPGNDGEYKYGSEDGEAGYGVGAAFENLGHTTRSRAEF